MPREIIPGEDDSPYALRSDLGWGIIGKISQPLSEEDGDEDEIGVSHRIYTCEAWEPPDPQVDAVEPSKRGCWKSHVRTTAPLLRRERPWVRSVFVLAPYR